MAVGIASQLVFAPNRCYVACSALCSLFKTFRLYVCNALILTCDSSKKSGQAMALALIALPYLAALELATSAWAAVSVYAKKAAVMAAFFVGEFASRARLFREAFG